jgi:tRNA (cmo5U34)-methyltransferase
MNKSSVDEIRERFDHDVERFSDLCVGTPAQTDSLLCLDLIAEAAAAAVPKATRLLDLGCGAGNYALKILERLPNERVSEATSGRVVTLQGDIRALELGAGTFDVIAAAAVLHHLRGEAEWHAVFAKLYTALATGGALLIYDLVQHSSPAVETLMMRRYGDELIGINGVGRDQVLGWIEQEDAPRPLMFQVDVLRAVGFQSVDVLHKNGVFAAFGAFK